MSQRWSSERDWDRTKSSSWRLSRLGRLRRPLFVAVCCVLVILWHHSTSNQHSPSPTANRRESLGHRSVQEPVPKVSPVSELFSQDNQDISEKRRLQETKWREDHLREDQLQEIRTIEKHLQDSHQGPAYKSSEFHQVQAGQEEDTEDAIPGEIEAIEKHLQAEHAEHRQVELLQEASQMRNEPPASLQQLAVGDTVNTEGSISITPKLDPETQSEPVISSSDQQMEKNVLETESQEHLSLEDKAALLPEIVHVTFEDAVRDILLEGWEDEWVADATFDTKKWGNLQEPKIDFVYLCKCSDMINTNYPDNDRGKRIGPGLSEHEATL